MRKSFYLFSVVTLLLSVLWLIPANAQERKATISGHATDTNHDPLVGAKVELQPLGQTAVTDAQGAFKIADLAPGEYTLTISYVGFTPFSKKITVASGGTANVDAELQIETVSEQVIVRGERERGEIEALNREETADNIVQVLPSEVITSLPNTNIADAVGRMPSVSLERDEGEGKYVQIRGTEPRLSNVTIDGVHVPSPEAVRNVKLDAIPADLVDSVEINKTLSANQEGDAIGGSVNLVTKKATDQPYITVLGMGGNTPIAGGRKLDQFTGTIGKRFGREKRLGVMLGGSYDWNGRGTDDVEPAPGTTQIGSNPAVPVFFGEDLREYWYDRTRFGFAASTDYKLSASAFLYLRGFFSQFRDVGQDWIYSPAPGVFTSPTTADNTGSMVFNHVYRNPWQQIFNVTVGAQHTFGSNLVGYEVSGA
jgi:TonB-dependent receptor